MNDGVGCKGVYNMRNPIEIPDRRDQIYNIFLVKSVNQKMMNAYLFKEQPLSQPKHSILTQLESSLSAFSEKSQKSNQFPSVREGKGKEGKERNWEAIQESIISWFQGRHITRGEPQALQQEFSHQQRKNIRAMTNHVGVSCPAPSSARRQRHIANILV